MRHHATATLDRPTRTGDLEQELVDAGLDRYDDMQLAAAFGVHPGDGADLRDWIRRPRRSAPARGVARREAIHESFGYTRNHTR